MSKPRAPKHIIARLENALRLAKFANASFGMPGDRVELIAGPINERKIWRTDEFVKEKTRLYRETWLIPEIIEALEWAKGE